MKFGGTSVGGAERLVAVTEIVRARVESRPIVVVSALAGVTDLLLRAVELATAGERDELEPVVADLERVHRWAITGSVDGPERRHRLSLEVDRLMEDLRRRLRSIRVLGEATARAADAVLALGEDLAAPILAAAMEERGLATRAVDPRRLIVTDRRFGGAEPDLESSRGACRATLGPLLEEGRIPVVGGFVGATPDGETTTLGRGGSDTSAAVLGLLLGAAEIQIWTDVDGLMSADPRLVPTARRLESVSFSEAAELACHGARVLHPASIAPAVRAEIPVLVLNSLRPGSAGTSIVRDPPAGPRARPVAVASRRGFDLLRARSRQLRPDPGFAAECLRLCADHGAFPEIVAGSQLSVSAALPAGEGAGRLDRALGAIAEVERVGDRALLWVVGSGLAADGELRRRLLEELGRWGPDLVAAGASELSLAALLDGARLEGCLRELHRRFFEDRS